MAPVLSVGRSRPRTRNWQECVQITSNCGREKRFSVRLWTSTSTFRSLSSIKRMILLPVVYWCKPEVTSLLVPSLFSKKFSRTLRSLPKFFSIKNWVLLPYCLQCHTAFLSLMTSWEGRMTHLWPLVMTWQRMEILTRLEYKSLKQVPTSTVVSYNWCENTKRHKCIEEQTMCALWLRCIMVVKRKASPLNPVAVEWTSLVAAR